MSPCRVMSVWAAVGEALSQSLQVLASFGQHDRAPALSCQLQRVPGDQLGTPLVGGERGVDLLVS
jgi:hypothetical protein